MKNKVLIKKIEDFMIVLLLVVCSYQSIFATKFNWLDEALIILFIVAELVIHKFKQSKYDKNTIVCLVAFIIVTMLTIVVRHYSFDAYFSDLFNYLKLFISLSFVSLMDIDDIRLKKYMRIYIGLIMVSILFGLYRYNNYSYQKGDMFRNGIWRMSGLSGHPVAMGFSSLLCCVFSKEIKTKNKKEKLLYLLCFVVSTYSIVLTKDRLPLALLLLYLLFKCVSFLAKKISTNEKKGKIILYSFVIFVGVLVIAFNYTKIDLSEDFDNTIRMFSLKKASEVFVKYPLLGTGIGSFDCTAAIKNNSYVYQEFDFSIFMDYAINVGDNAFESFFAKIVIETGLVGIAFHFFLFYRYYKYAYYNKNFLLLFLLLSVNIYMIFNKAYQIPFIIGVSIVASYNFNRFFSDNDFKNNIKKEQMHEESTIYIKH